MTGSRALGIVLAGAVSMAACGTFDPADPFGMQKLDPAYKAAAEANKQAPHIYDRAPTQAERDQVHAACQAYVRQQAAALMGSTIFSTSATGSTVLPPNVDRCEMQHFNLQAHNAAVVLHEARPANTLPAY